MPLTRFWDIFLVLRLFLPYCLLLHSKQSLIRKIFYSLFKPYCFNIYIKLFILQKGLWKTLQKREMLKWTSRYPTRKYFIFSLLYDSFKSIILKHTEHVEHAENLHDKSSDRKFSIKKVFLKKACNFIKKETTTPVFSCVFCEISKNNFFTEDFPATASLIIHKLI